MRSALLLALLVSVPVACALTARSPALQSPMQDRLAKAETTTIEDATKVCLQRGGWTPDDVGEYREGANVVSAKNAAKERISVYIQAPEVKPRVTGGPEYDNPFWRCLGSELANPTPPAPSASASGGAEE
jgi:hypothetical protein